MLHPREPRLAAARHTQLPMHFDEFAADYEKILDENVAASGEDSNYFAEYKARYLARVLAPGFQGKVLDFGCGVGLLTRFLRREFPGARMDGFDVSPKSLQRLDEDVMRGGTFTSERERLAHDYDLIVAANVLHHVAPAHREETIQELTARLAPSGWLAVFEHNPLNPVTRRAVDRCAFDRDAILLKMRETASYFAGARLALVRRDYIVFMPRFLAWLRPLEPWLAGVPLGAQYVVIGKKSGENGLERRGDVGLRGGQPR